MSRFSNFTSLAEVILREFGPVTQDFVIGDEPRYWEPTQTQREIYEGKGPISFNAEIAGRKSEIGKYNRWFWRMQVDAMNQRAELMGRDIWSVGQFLVESNSRGELNPDPWWAFVRMVRANLKTVGIKHYPLPEPSTYPFSSDSYRARCERISAGVDEDVLFDG